VPEAARLTLTTTADIVVDSVNHEGTYKMATALITGGHGGIGYKAAIQLAKEAHFNLILAGRDLARVDAAAEKIRAAYGVKVTTLQMDTSSLSSVRLAAARCKELLGTGKVDSLEAVLCNAGARIEAVNYTPDGYEETFATNYLGHFLLVELLVDHIAPNGRVVITTSGTHDPDKMDGKLMGGVVEPNALALANDGKAGKKPTSAGRRYATSKLCSVLHVYELDRRLRRSGSSIASIAFDPGAVSGSGFLRGMPKPVQWLSTTAFFGWFQRRLGITMGSLEFSGKSLGKLASEPSYMLDSGKYYESNDGRLVEARSSKMSYDDQRANRLWMDSKELVHLSSSEESAQLR
jgi:NAD(P)-dependent dehydrogenase (short-subunit alcohol dehydrogenase family)